MATLLLLTTGFGAEAATAPVTTLAGYGARTCQQLAAGMTVGSSFQSTQTGLGVVAWAQGYLSGLNAIRGNAHERMIDLTGGRASELWTAITAGCRDFPSKTIEDVTAEFFLQHQH